MEIKAENAKKTNILHNAEPCKETDSSIKDGYLIDYISGTPVKDGPEERDAIQVFARMLVEDYGYPKTQIQTRPQYRVKVRPSDTKKEYPIDIAVFGNEKKTMTTCSL